MLSQISPQTPGQGPPCAHAECAQPDPADIFQTLQLYRTFSPDVFRVNTINLGLLHFAIFILRISTSIFKLYSFYIACQYVSSYYTNEAFSSGNSKDQ